MGDAPRAHLPLRFYNTLTRAVEEFNSLVPGQVGIYCCGPTVYGFQHIGNLRTYVFEDVLVRTLRYAGYDVQHVMNITDVGHLVGETDEGEDKMLVAMRREGKSSREIADFYTEVFFRDCTRINIVRPDIVCKATDHIGEMIDLTQRLEQRGLAYSAAGNVYFDVQRFPDYPKFAQLDLENLKSGARIEVDQSKHSPFDFALWFTKSKFENQELQWDSPWGRGYPGWHIECSAMSMRYLGEQFDIHCGGIDHIPVHHTNEVAQSQGATGKSPARYWMHGAFLSEGSEDGNETRKMSKSLGNVTLLDDLERQGIDPLAHRLFCLNGSYRSPLSWNWRAFEGAHNSLRRLRAAVQDARGQEATTEPQAAAKYIQAFRDALADDLNTAKALAVLHGVVGDSALPPGDKLGLIKEFDSVLGLGLADWKEEEIPAEVRELASRRQGARQARDFRQADELRAEIGQRGYAVEDTKDGFILKKM